MEKKIKSAMITSVCIAAIGISGCMVSPSTETDEEMIWNMLNEDGILNSVSAMNMNEGLESEDGSYIYFQRKYNNDSMTTHFDITITGDHADAVANYDLDGTFYVMYDDSTLVPKPFTGDHGTRNIYLVKRGDSSRFGGREVESISMLSGTSMDDIQRIERVTVESPSIGEIVFEDTDQSWEKNVLTFAPGEKVTVTVEVNDPSVIAVLHRLTSNNSVDRKFLEPTGEENVFSNVFTTPTAPGLYHTFVDIIDSQSILDGDAPYSASAWGMPYWIE